MEKLRRLRPLFGNVTAASLVAGGPLACSSGTASDSTPIDTSSFTSNVCDGTGYRPLVGIVPSRPIDFVALREQPTRSASQIEAAGDAGSTSPPSYRTT